MSEDVLPSTRSPAWGSLTAWKNAVAFGVVYFLLAEAGRFLSVRDSAYVSFWLPAGLYAAVPVISEPRAWPLLLLAAFVANLAFDLIAGTAPDVTLLFSLANAVQMAGSAVLVRRFVAERPTLATLGEFVGFMGFAAILAPMAGAAIGAGTLVAYGLSDSMFQSWRVWWGSNAMAILVFSPFIITWSAVTRADAHRFTRPARILEAVLLTIVLVALNFHQLFAFGGVMGPTKGALVAGLVYAGLRFGPRGGAAAILLTAVLVAYFTTQFHAGLTPEQVASGEYVLIMQLVLVLGSLMTWIPAVIVGERDRKIAELRDSETRLRLANQASNIGLWDWDIMGERIYFSPEAKRQLGYRDEEIASNLGEWPERLHPEDGPRALAALQACLEEGRSEYEGEYRLRHRDGSYRWIYARGEILRDEANGPQRMLGCNMDITERKLSEAELQRSLSRLQELSRRLVEIEGEERRRISRELHDRVGQNLAALNLNLQVIRGQLTGGCAPGVETRLDDSQKLLEATSRHVRDVMAELRPAALDDYGLHAALRTYAGDYAKRSGVAVTVQGGDPAPRLPIAMETELFRIAQEALHNIAKHARAGKVEVVLAAVGEHTTLSIADDGIGFDATAPRPAGRSWGMTTMRERADAIGAVLRVDSEPGRGTRISVEVQRP